MKYILNAFLFFLLVTFLNNNNNINDDDGDGDGEFRKKLRAWRDIIERNTKIAKSRLL